MLYYISLSEDVTSKHRGCQLALVSLKEGRIHDIHLVLFSNLGHFGNETFSGLMCQC